MKELWKRILCALLVCAFIYVIVDVSYFGRQKQAQQLEVEKMQQAGLDIWYSDDKYTSYLSAAAAEFEKTNDVEIRINLVSSGDYLQQIAKQSIATSEAVTPDLFIVKENLLENAYTAGLTVENTSDRYTEENFAKTALDSVSYRGKKIAYPLCFQTSCMLYRSDIFAEEPKSVEQIINTDISLYIENGVEKTLDFNTQNSLIEYAFVGKYIDIGGNAGDDKDSFILDENMLSQAVMFFQSAVTNVGIVPEALDESVVFDYAEGKTLSLIISTDYLPLFISQSKQAEKAYKIIKVPRLTDTIESKNSSNTDVVVVNGLSLNQELAGAFAEFLTCDYAKNLYKLSKLYPACHEAGADIDEFEAVYNIYRESVTFPKIMQAEDFSFKLNELFDKIVNGKDITQSVTEFSNGIKSRLVKQ